MKDKRVKYGLYFIIIIGIVSHIMPYVFNRSLWIDEARLASSIVNRSLGTLTADTLDLGQSAPIGYLYVVKLLTMMFGTGEAALRLWSLLAFYGCLIVFIKIAKRMAGAGGWLVYTAVFAVIPNYIYYGNELKPYMSDCFFVLLSIMIYCMYQEDRLRLWQLAAAYAVIIWFSFAAVFYVAGGMILISIRILLSIVRKKAEIKSIGNKIFSCLLVLLSFLANYVLWLSATSGNAEGQEYWELLAFPLIPTSLSDAALAAQMVREMLLPFGVFGYILLALAAAKLIQCIRVRRAGIMEQQLLCGTALLLIASYLGFYPIQGRLVLFVSMTLFLFDISMIEKIVEICCKKKSAYRIGLGVFGILMFGSYLFGTVRYWRPGGVYMAGSEISESLKYLAENKSPDDKVYVRNEAIPSFLYAMDYPWGDADLMYDTPVIKDDYILGQPTYAYFYEIPYSYAGETLEDAVLADAALIEQYDSVYIYTSHEIAEKKEDTQELLKILKKSGSVETVVCYYGTYLYHYVKNGAD